MSRIAWVLCRRTATVLTAAAAVLCFAAIAAVSAQASSATFGTTGSDPYGMVMDSAGNIYVANWGSSNVTKITPNGTSTVNWGPDNTQVTTGTHPVGIVMDSAGNLYTANQSTSFSCPGFAMDCSTVSKITPEGNSTSNWATVGSTPTDITIDGTGNIYTVSNGGGVSKITSQGVATTSWATTGSQPHGVVVDSAGNVYTANGGSNDVSKITPDGTVSTVDWGPVGHTHVTTGNKPYNITIDQAGNLYTTNELSNNVSKITPDGTSTVNWGPGATEATTGTQPNGITIDSAGNIFTANYASNNVTWITPQGSSSTLDTTGTSPTSITRDSVGRIYTANHVANSVTRITATPNAPTGLVATLGNGSASIAFTPGANNGPTTTNFQYSTDNGTSWTTRSPASTASPLVVTGLTNGTTYQIKLRAINGIGSGTVSTAASVTPATTPDAPTGLVATAGNGSASITFTAGPNNGSAITNYEYSTDNGGSWTTRSPASTASPLVITGLTNGTTYQIKLRAINGIPTGTASTAATVTPSATAPDAPTALVATLGNGSASIAFTAGANNGSAITNYEYSTDNGGSWTTRSPAATTSPIVITGLTNGTTYQIKLRAINGIGSGTASTAVSVTPAAPAPDPAPTPSSAPAAAPASAAPSAPTKPAVVWSSSIAAKTVTAVITPTNGVTYGITAKSGATTKSGTCKNVTTKQGKTDVTRRSCTIKLGKGTWLVSVTPTKGGVAGPAATKTYAFK